MRLAIRNDTVKNEETLSRVSTCVTLKNRGVLL